jgi:hypothetical protein
MANFNEQYLRGLKPKLKPFRTMDTGKGAVDGLSIQVTTGGRKNWFIRYRDQRNARKFHKIGTYPELTIAMGRDKARTTLGSSPSTCERTNSRRSASGGWRMLCKLRLKRW